MFRVFTLPEKKKQRDFPRLKIQMVRRTNSFCHPCATTVRCFLMMLNTIQILITKSFRYRFQWTYWSPYVLLFLGVGFRLPTAYISILGTWNCSWTECFLKFLCTPWRPKSWWFSWFFIFARIHAWYLYLWWVDILLVNDRREPLQTFICH